VAKDPDQKRDALRRFLQDRQLKPAPWAKAAGVNANALYNFLNGVSQSLSGETYAKLARAAEVPVWRISGEQPDPPSPTTIWVAGHVEAGEWREAIEWDRSLQYPVDVPVPLRFRGKAKALEVRGRSMDLVYAPGSIVMWVELMDFRAPRDGDRVIVYAYRDDDTIEATVKELRIDGTDRWLWPRSTDPGLQQPVNTTSPGDRIRSIEIKGIVIGSYRPEVF
jgi:SOS-response transcriptional repressor LexA